VLPVSEAPRASASLKHRDLHERRRCKAGVPRRRAPRPALWAPRATPRGIIDKLNTTVVEAVADPAVRRRLTAELGQDVPSRAQQTQEALYAYQKAEKSINRPDPFRPESSAAALPAPSTPAALRWRSGRARDSAEPR
jgi:hypothetical protein